jgi:type I restriction enzyme S subunit
MIAELKPYPEYKESGLPWLWRVPSTWRIVRNGSLFGQRNQTGYQELPILEVSLKTGVRVRDFENSTRKQVMADIGKYKRAAKGDVAYNMMRMWQGAVGVSPVDGLVSPAYVVARPYPQVEPRFFVALFRTGDYMSEIDNCSRGIVKDRNRLYWDQFKQILSPCPPPAEQAAIVRFLDWANGRLERAIRAKRQVIALLNEQKQAIIHRAVTRGLDPDVPLKDSGIPWLGKIPVHWEIISLRMRYSVELGKMLDAKRITGRNSLPYLRNRDVQWDKIIVSNLPSMDISPKEIERYTVKRGDLLVCEGGQVGRCAFWEEQLPTCGFQKALHRLRALKPASDFPRFFFYQMQLAARLGIFAADGNENTIAHLTCEKLRRRRFAFPPYAEQKAIAEQLDSELQQFQDTANRIEREIELLREYRTRLVADVVTGKLDVREVSARFPEEVAPNTAESVTDWSDETEPADEEVAV